MVARFDVQRRRWRGFGWIAAAALVAGLALPWVAFPARGSAPPSHRVEICHATPPDTARNGWHAVTVDVASIGYQHSGHQSTHDADIIPPYAYGRYQFAGKNWTTAGQAIWNSDCRAMAPTVSPTPSVVPSGSIVPTATPTATATATGSVAPSGSVAGTTGTPARTLPPTDSPIAATGARSDPSAVLAMLVLALAVTSVGARSLAERSIRRRR